MKLICYNYCFYIFLGGGFILLLLTIMAYLNCQGLKIKKGKHNNSGTILLTNTILYFLCAYYFNSKILKEKELNNRKNNELQYFEMTELRSIN